MQDMIYLIITDFFKYFFAENAPFTIILVIFGVALFSMSSKMRRIEKLKTKHAIEAETFKAQMNHYDDSIGVLEQRLNANFMSLRKDTLVKKETEKIQMDRDIPLSMDEYKSIEYMVKATLGKDGEVHRFCSIMENIKTGITPIFRRVYTLNHLSEKTPKEFEAHIADRVNNIISVFTKELDNRYWAGTEPDRVQLYDSQQLLIPELSDTIKAILRHGREISIEYNKSGGLKSDHFITDFLK